MKPLIPLVCSFLLTCGVAHADPDWTAVISTTCTYDQIQRAVNAENPVAAVKFNSSPEAQGWLRLFLDSPPDKRARMVDLAMGLSGAPQYFTLIGQLAVNCNNY